MIHLRGERVALRALERQDCRYLWQRYEIDEPLPAEPPRVGLSVEGAEAWFEEIQAKQGSEHVHLGIVSTDGELLGDIQVANIDWRARTATLGCGIALRANRGCGYGTDAARAILRYGFEELDLYRIEASTAEFNAAARRSLEKLGFSEEGRRRRAIYRNGRRWDGFVYGLLREEFGQKPG
jgi:RimJ/RimL family protein N-acetyltransferase